LIVRRSRRLVAVGLVLACQPNTSRPSFTPLPEAAGIEVRLPVRDATRHLAEDLKASAIPIRKVMIRDGYMESGWFSARTGRPTNRRPLGTGTVRVRAWADPARPGSSLLSVETSYRPTADPSLPERELDRQVPRDHPVAVKVTDVLKKLVERYGGPPPPQSQPPAAPVTASDEQ
jgi:hypothetical protein